MAKMEYFKEDDWDAFAGAECAEDGRLPMIGETKDEKDESALVVADAQGIEVLLETEETTLVFNKECSYDVAVTLARGLEGPITEQLLEGLGFELVVT